jgi:excisionase family DNA binding protein
MTTKADNLLTVEEVADALGTSTRNVRRMIAAGRLPAIKPTARRLYVPGRAVREELEARRLAADIAYAIRHGEPAQRSFNGTCSNTDVLRRALDMAWRVRYDAAEDENGWDVWGWSAETPWDDQDWRIFVRRAPAPEGEE